MEETLSLKTILENLRVHALGCCTSLLAATWHAVLFSFHLLCLVSLSFVLYFVCIALKRSFVWMVTFGTQTYVHFFNNTCVKTREAMVGRLRSFADSFMAFLRVAAFLVCSVAFATFVSFFLSGLPKKTEEKRNPAIDFLFVVVSLCVIAVVTERTGSEPAVIYEREPRRPVGPGRGRVRRRGNRPRWVRLPQQWPTVC